MSELIQMLLWMSLRTKKSMLNFYIPSSGRIPTLLSIRGWTSTLSLLHCLTIWRSIGSQSSTHV
ncbi:unnamed protein product [Linum tenue]|uniref:Uncharacterized protein n=1 Tax=Linum tenue TaxID=586396 RepID=A0AAV0IUR4_9ROSI|nr:unnamed protein product [Linum tenue]